MTPPGDSNTADQPRAERHVLLVHAGQLVVTAEDVTLATPVLGSDVAIALHHAEAAMAGLLHFMLPTGDLDPVRRAAHPELFADGGFALLVDRMQARAGPPSGLVAWIVGGADPIQRAGDPSPAGLGARNVEIAERLLADAGIEKRGERVGGHRARRLLLDVASGIARITETPSHRKVDALPG